MDDELRQQILFSTQENMKRYISFHNETVIKGMTHEKSHLGQHPQ